MFTLDRFNDAGARLEPSAQLPTLNAARYAAARTAQQQGCKVSIYDEDGDPRGCTYPSVTAAQIAEIEHQDLIDRLDEARDQLAHIIDKTRFMRNLAGELVELHHHTEAYALIDATYSLAKHGLDRAIFGTPCATLAAQSPAADWYTDAHTDALDQLLTEAENAIPEEAYALEHS